MMEIGCGGMGLRTSHGDVVNLYFWHLEADDHGALRHEEFLGRADSPRVKRELLRRMAMYNRNEERRLARHASKLEREMARIQGPVAESHEPVAVAHGSPGA